PELHGAGGWIGTGGTSYGIADFRGRIVVLDFWTFCCVNCLHVIEELRPLEERYADVLVVVGVHSPKFPHEADHAALAAAVERYELHHPVLDDPELHTWRQYAVRAWPTLVVIDPEGYVVSVAAGEGHVEALDRLVAELVTEHQARGTLRTGDGPYVPPPPAATALRFPGGATITPDGTLLVADTGHHSLVELAPDGETVLRRIGTGERGQADGGPGEASFAEPQGLTTLPAEVAAATGFDVVVADTVNHLIRGVRLADGRVGTIADLPVALADAQTVTGPVPPVPSPWDVAWWDGRLVVAAAGVHLLLGVDVHTGAAEILAGTTVEGLKDGPAGDAWLAQPSGLAAAGGRLWIADAETSALRWLERAGDGYTIRTAAGEGLFDFGHVDGPAATARFQHPLGVTALPDGGVAVLDTYNGAVRRYDPAAGTVSTLATDLAEPVAAVLDGGDLVVVESAGHRLTRPVAPGTMREIVAPARRTARPPTDVAPGPLALTVVFEPAPGQRLDDRYGPSTRLQVSASPPELLREGAGESVELTRRLVLADGVPEGVLHVTAQAASCDVGVEHPACHVSRQDWGVPVRVRAGAADRLTLMLRGLDPAQT
ncbi:MAG TPA: thioredoxin-like domain-containing protein, partial [Mycobacteriales bacterium]|nr:thioredoxin-like domain-containing protein [Mycobacteriales bacterium]